MFSEKPYFCRPTSTYPTKALTLSRAIVELTKTIIHIDLILTLTCIRRFLF